MRVARSLTALRADGTALPVEISIAGVRVIGPPLFTAHLRDISDRQRVERERAALEEKERAARIDAETANLLDVSRIVSGKMQVTRSAVDLAGVVRGALDAVQPACLGGYFSVVDEGMRGTFRRSGKNSVRRARSLT